MILLILIEVNLERLLKLEKYQIQIHIKNNSYKIN